MRLVINKQRKTWPFVFAVFLGGILAFNNGCSRDDALPKLTVHIIDVGQGDAIFLEGVDFSILVDAGRHDQNDVVPYLESLDLDSIDLLIGTHPHADHIGQFPQVLENFTVNEVWMSGDIHTTRTFERVLDAILATDARYREPRAGQIYHFGDAVLEVVHPVEMTGNLNDGSIVIRVIYGEISFLLTGDAEHPAEQEMLERGHDLQSNILKLGHHGSRSSSTQEFLDAVNPEIAIYSAGDGNFYGHPHPEVINRLNQMGIDVYGTNVNGNILVVTDGTGYEIQTRRGQTVLTSPVTREFPAGCIDLNTAGRSELMQIVHIGESRVDTLIELRPFESVEQLAKIDGIGEERLNEIQHLQQLACVN